MKSCNDETSTLSRRSFLGSVAFAAVGMALLPETPARALQESNPYAPFKMGLQSYSLRHFGLDDALAKTKELGLTYWEAYPDHIPVTADAQRIDDYKSKLDSHGIELVSYGVVDFRNDESDARRKFDFAKAMNIKVITANPSPDSLDLLDKLVDEYDILIGIHNHGPGDNLYDTSDKVMAAIKGHSRRIGVCEDTGHYLRSNVSPANAAQQFGSRLYDVHLKAVRQGPGHDKEFTEIGKVGSLLDVVGFFRLLQQEKYSHLIALEYEIHEEDPMPYMQQCLEAVRRYCYTIRDYSASG